ncbi:sortase domain-bontaining protein [Lacticaseibacillus hulanensis]|uniref:sortase domain-containing protein n=1 Tax=Lacticaseibacillus hulanensis TaxID=2493111 RepID=UPI000FDC12A7|nr:sortase [Lacticaseibacillus hulanensis]
MKIKYRFAVVLAVIAGFGGFLGKNAQSTQAATVKDVATVTAKSTRIYKTPGTRKTNSTLRRGTRRTVSSMKTVRGGTWYSVGRNQWVKYSDVAVRTSKTVNNGSINFLGKTTKISRGNTMVNTAPTGNSAQTWGGQAVLSTRDHLSTHIIGHNTSNFGNITRLKIGSRITVRDAYGHTKVYHVKSAKNVTDFGLVAGTRTNVYGKMVSAYQGEQIVLQTCLSSRVNRVVWAK